MKEIKMEVMHAATVPSTCFQCAVAIWRAGRDGRDGRREGGEKEGSVPASNLKGVPSSSSQAHACSSARHSNPPSARSRSARRHLTRSSVAAASAHSSFWHPPFAPRSLSLSLFLSYIRLHKDTRPLQEGNEKHMCTGVYAWPKLSASQKNLSIWHKPLASIGDIDDIGDIRDIGGSLFLTIR